MRQCVVNNNVRILVREDDKETLSSLSNVTAPPLLYIYIHIHRPYTQIHMYTYTYIHTYAHIPMHKHIHMHIHTHVNTLCTFGSHSVFSKDVHILLPEIVSTCPTRSATVAGRFIARLGTRCSRDDIAKWRRNVSFSLVHLALKFGRAGRGKVRLPACLVSLCLPFRHRINRVIVIKMISGRMTLWDLVDLRDVKFGLPEGRAFGCWRMIGSWAERG